MSSSSADEVVELVVDRGVAMIERSRFRAGVLRYSESTGIENRMELRPAAITGNMLFNS